MFCFTYLRFLKPRYLKNAPPQLVRKMGDFRCRNCNFWWHSEFVWCTKLTSVCYQGQQCERCGQQEKPYYIAEAQERAQGRLQFHLPLAAVAIRTKEAGSVEKEREIQVALSN